MPLAAAIVADSGDDHPVSRDAEAMFVGHRLADRLQLVCLELNQLIANLAIQMIVLRVSIIVLVYGPAAKGHFAEQPGLDQFIQSAVNGGPADAVAVVPLGEAVDQLVGIKMIVPLENMIHQGTSLLGNPLPTDLQIFLKPLPRRKRDLNFTQ